MNPPFNTARRGISLLEVLISMGILAIGLGSVLALFPAGKSQAKKGAVEDRRGSLGAAALADAVNRGFLRKSTWSVPSAVAVVLDPLPGILSGTPATFPVNLTPITCSGTRAAFADAFADEFFRGQDDLVYVTPADDASPPTPKFIGTPPAKRLSEGHFTWLATLVPAGVGSDYYRLSIVEFYKRPFDATPNESWRQFKPSLETPVTWSPSTGLSKAQYDDFFKSGMVVLASDESANHQWLRVLMAAPTDNPNGTTVDSVDLTFDQDPQFTPVTIFVYAGAVGVAEQIVRLEGDLPWIAP